MKKLLIANNLKLINRQMIYRFIRDNESVSKNDIIIGLKLSMPTVTQNLNYLEKKKLIDTSKKIKFTGGRNATAYTYIKNARHAIGVYITAYHITVVAVDLSGNVVEMKRERIKFNLDDDGYLKKLGELIELVKENASIANENILGVGIATPGLVSDDGEKVIYGRTFNFTGKTREQIAKYIPYKNRLFHDSFVSGYAEVWIDKRIQNAFYISLNNSVGGSVIIDGNIYTGNTNKGGEIGHMVVWPKDGKQCYCGKHGCFDAYCNSGNLARYTDDNHEEFFRLLKEGDSTAKKLWLEYINFLAPAINNIRMLFDSVVILGGYIGAYTEEYLEDICKCVDDLNPFGDKAKEFLIPCKYKIEATSAGAAIMYIDEFIENIDEFSEDIDEFSDNNDE